jgi:ATP-binding cassette subfamily B protein
MAWLGAAYVQSGSVIAMLAAVVVLVVGGLAVVDRTTSLGSLLAFYALAALQRGYLSTIAVAVPEIISAGESLARVRTVLEAHEPQPYTGRHVPIKPLPVVLKDVHFAYQEDVPVLRGVSMEIRAGDLLAIVGPNGAGKSTIANLILGFYRPVSGCLLAGDVPYDELDTHALLRHMGSVAQDPVLFSATVAENIGYGEPAADRARIVAAAQRATAHDFIAELPRGYDTPVGDEGALLSGGEGQRIAIARALLRAPELLILDEPTANLDRDAVAALLGTLRESAPDRAVVVISHDPEVVLAADRVYALSDGVLSVEPVGHSVA